VPWLRRLVAGLSQWRPELSPESVHVRFVVDQVALGQVHQQVLRVSLINSIPPWLSTLICHLGTEASVERHRLTLST
jgi:hypothetical protein